MKSTEWISTKEMADAAAFSVATLGRLKRLGFFTETKHYRKINPASSDRAPCQWNKSLVLIKLNRY